MDFFRKTLNKLNLLESSPPGGNKVRVRKEHHSWGDMAIIEVGHSFSIPLHNEHLEAIAAMKDGGYDVFRVETGDEIGVKREGDKIHFTAGRGRGMDVTVDRSELVDDQIHEYGKTSILGKMDRAKQAQTHDQAEFDKSISSHSLDDKRKHMRNSNRLHNLRFGGKKTAGGFPKSTIHEGCWSLPDTPEKQKRLAKILSKPLLGDAATHAIYNYIGDDSLFDRIGNEVDWMNREDIPVERQVVNDMIIDWMKKNAEHYPGVPEVLRLLRVPLDEADQFTQDEVEPPVNAVNQQFQNPPAATTPAQSSARTLAATRATTNALDQTTQKMNSTTANANQAADQMTQAGQKIDQMAQQAQKPAAPKAAFYNAKPTQGQYTIKKGETLSGIAKANGVTLQQLLQANPNIKDPNRVAAGAGLNLPQKAAAAPAQQGAPQQNGTQGDDYTGIAQMSQQQYTRWAQNNPEEATKFVSALSTNPTLAQNASPFMKQQLAAMTPQQKQQVQAASQPQAAPQQPQQASGGTMAESTKLGDTVRFETIPGTLARARVVGISEGQLTVQTRFGTEYLINESEVKKAKKDYDKDGKIESEKDEVWGSRMKAAKKSENLKESGEEVWTVTYHNERGKKESERDFTSKEAADAHAKRGNAKDKVGGKYKVTKTRGVNESVDELKKIQGMDKGSVTGGPDEVKKRRAYLNALLAYKKKTGTNTSKVKKDLERLNRAKLEESVDLDSWAQEYDDNEENNYHTENVLMVAELVGTDKDVAMVKKIMAERDRMGGLNQDLYDVLSNINRRLWPKVGKLFNQAHAGQTMHEGWDDEEDDDVRRADDELRKMGKRIEPAKINTDKDKIKRTDKDKEEELDEMSVGKLRAYQGRAEKDYSDKLKSSGSSSKGAQKRERGLGMAARAIYDKTGSLEEQGYTGKGNHRPGWMLKADPALGKELRDRKKAARPPLSGPSDEYKKRTGQLEEKVDLGEKAVSKKQQQFFGMVRATQKGEKPKSEKIAKAAKSMSKSDVKDFAKTKHKGLPKKVKKTDESTTSGGIAVAPAPMSYKNEAKMKAYESKNTELERLIKESLDVSVNINKNDSGTPSKTITVTARDDDAEQLARLLNMAGLGEMLGQGGTTAPQVAQMPVHNGTPVGMPAVMGPQEPSMQQLAGIMRQEPEVTIVGSSDPEVIDEVDENEPDWPTNPETSSDPFQYSGGLNRPKSTGQTTTPVRGTVYMPQRGGMFENVELERTLFKAYQAYKGDE